jgi:hypothetical protein
MLRHGFASKSPASPGGLEVEAAGDAVDIEAFAPEVESGDLATLHGSEVDFFQAHAAAGHEFVFVGSIALFLNVRVLRSARVCSAVRVFRECAHDSCADARHFSPVLRHY